MKLFENPEMEVVSVELEDIIATSETVVAPTTGGNSLPIL